MSAPYNFETKTMRQVKKASDIPAGVSYVIQFHEAKDIHHEGDERSRTNPGHGYPAYTEHIDHIEQYVTLDDAEWREAIQALILTGYEGKFAAAMLSRPGIHKKTTIEIKGGK